MAQDNGRVIVTIRVGSKYVRCLSHVKPHPDDLLAMFLLEIFADAGFCEHYIVNGVIPVGIDGGAFDEHGKKGENSASTLVRAALREAGLYAVDGKNAPETAICVLREFDKLVDYFSEIDRVGGAQKSISAIMRQICFFDGSAKWAQKCYEAFAIMAQAYMGADGPKEDQEFEFKDPVTGIQFSGVGRMDYRTLLKAFVFSKAAKERLVRPSLRVEFELGEDVEAFVNGLGLGAGRQLIDLFLAEVEKSARGRYGLAEVIDRLDGHYAMMAKDAVGQVFDQVEMAWLLFEAVWREQELFSRSLEVVQDRELTWSTTFTTTNDREVKMCLIQAPEDPKRNQKLSQAALYSGYDIIIIRHASGHCQIFVRKTNNYLTGLLPILARTLRMRERALEGLDRIADVKVMSGEYWPDRMAVPSCFGKWYLQKSAGWLFNGSMTHENVEPTLLLDPDITVAIRLVYQDGFFAKEFCEHCRRGKCYSTPDEPCEIYPLLLPKCFDVRNQSKNGNGGGKKFADKPEARQSVMR